MTRSQLDRYLRLLGVRRAEPSLDALAELVRAHLERVPFENVSKLYRMRRSGLRDLPELDEHLDGVERWRLGGTCYANNVYLRELLLALGYDARLCGADMSRPDVHAVVVVALAGRDFLVDAGYGAPLLAPMPLGLDREQVFALGRERYVLHPRDAQGRSALEHLRDGRSRHRYVVQPAPRELGHFRPAIADSFRPDATFMNAVVIACFAPGRARVLRNLSLVEMRDDREDRVHVADRGELLSLAASVFGVPPEIMDEALGAVRDLTKDLWG